MAGAAIDPTLAMSEQNPTRVVLSVEGNTSLDQK